MAVTMSAARAALPKPPQNWILNPLQDTLFVVAAPLVVLALALALFAAVGASDATTYILLLHVVLTVAHHTPTFIRVYGDVDLFLRFKWTFIFGPLIPFAFATGVLTYLNARDFPVESLLYLFLLLTIWDPWHFLMQHYGFMRIYDRHNAAPKRLASRMDLALCVSWFVFIMLASGEWLTGLLEDLYLSVNVPLILALPTGLLPVISGLIFTAASLATIGYGLYVAWCWRHGFFVSLVKLTLFATTFGVMFLAYTPNQWILALAPGWTFKVGFAVLGIVHMTQYLAIVWRYNRSLAAQPDRARAGLFRHWHARGGWIRGGGYVLLCLAYGAMLTSVHDNPWLMSVLLAAGFTSTLMHYYFDGFIWKMRHRQNAEQFAREPESSTAHASAAGTASVIASASWWDAARRTAPAAVFLRQLLYFGVPMTVLTAGALWAWNGPGTQYAAHMMRGQTLYEQGEIEDAFAHARSALRSMEWQLPAAERLAAMQPTAARRTSVAFLLYNSARYREMLIPTLEGAGVSAEGAARYRDAVTEAVALLQLALDDGGPLGRIGSSDMRREDVSRTLASWRSELDRMQIEPTERQPMR